MSKLTPEFVYIKNLSVNKRVLLIITVASIGFVLQLAVSPVLGWPFVLVSALFGAVRGRSNRPKNIKSGGEWEPVTIEELEKTKNLLNQTEQSDYDFKNFLLIGRVIYFAALVVAGVLFMFVDGGSFGDLALPVTKGGPFSVPFAVDMTTFAIVIWMCGGVSAWEPPDLRVRLEQMKLILAKAKANPQLDFQPSLQLVKSANGMVPVDCKLLVKIKDAPPEFIGIQVQVSFNIVQSRKYPYTYCVILAKPEFDLVKKANMVEMPPPGGFSVGLFGLFADENDKREAKFARFHGSLIEFKQENDVGIAVVRQNTAATVQGYSTSPTQALEVFSDAYLLAKSIIR